MLPVAGSANPNPAECGEEHIGLPEGLLHQQQMGKKKKRKTVPAAEWVWGPGHIVQGKG